MKGYETYLRRCQHSDYVDRYIDYGSHKDELRRFYGRRRQLSKILRDEGVVGMYRGLSLNLVRTLPAVAVTFTTYEKIVQELASHQDQDSNDAYLGGMFQMSHEELVAQLSPDVAKMWNDGGSLAHLKRTYDPMKSPVKYRRMRIDYGWFIKPTQTYTTEINAPYAQFMSDKKNMDSN